MKLCIIKEIMVFSNIKIDIIAQTNINFDNMGKYSLSALLLLSFANQRKRPPS